MAKNDLNKKLARRNRWQIAFVTLLFINTLMLLFLMILQSTPKFDEELMSYTYSKVCKQDYSYLAARESDGGKFFAASVCARNAKTGEMFSRSDYDLLLDN